MKSFSLRSPLSAACLSLVLLAAPAAAQTTSWVSTESGATGWHEIDRWSDGVPTSTSHALFGGTPTEGSIITFFTFPAAPNNFFDVGAISLVAGATQGRSFRGNNGATLGTGELRLHGFDTTIDDNPVTLLIANFSPNYTLLFTQGTSSVQSLALYQSGVIHTVGQITLTNPITDDGNNRSITKTGEGLLRLSSQSSGTTAAGTYSGGFILEQGIVEWIASGSADPHATPFGTGPLTLRGGSLRSTSTTARNIFNSVVIEGDSTFGSQVSGFTGSITIQPTVPDSVTTLATDATITFHNRVDWDQTITGGNVTFTKAGAGTLDIGQLGSQNDFSGGFILDGGVLTTYGNTVTTDGVLTSGPFGTGALTLRNGQIGPNSTTGSRTWTNAVVIDGDIEFGSTSQSGNITFSRAAENTTTLTGDHTFTVNTSGTLSWQQDISGDHRITKDGQGQLSFVSTATNSFASLTVKEGIVQFGSASSLPANPDTVQADHMVLDGGTLQFTAFGSTLLSNRGIQITSAGGNLSVLGGWLMGMNGPMTDADPENPGAFTKSGTGTWTFSSLSTPTYSGPTTVTEGRLVVNTDLPNSAVEVLTGARVGGNGTFGQPLTVRSGGELFVGARTEVGTTTAMAAVLLEAGSFLSYRLQGPAAFDQLQIHDSLTLDGVEMQFALDYQPSVDDAFVLVNNLGLGSIVGTLSFGGNPLADGSTFQLTGALLDPDTSEVLQTYIQDFQIFYNYLDSNSLAIVAVPEPATWANLAGILSIGLAIYWRRRVTARRA